MDDIQNEEIREKFKKEFSSVYINACSIGVAFIACVIIYLLIAVMINKGIIPLSQPAGSDAFKNLKYIFLGMTFITIFLIMPVRRRILTQKSILAFNAKEKSEISLPLQNLRQAAIISYSFCNSVALYGVVYYFLSRDINGFYLFIIISLFLFNLHFPRYRQWESWVCGTERKAE
jgi:hypothetical protein